MSEANHTDFDDAYENELRATNENLSNLIALLAGLIDTGLTGTRLIAKLEEEIERIKRRQNIQNLTSRY